MVALVSIVLNLLSVGAAYGLLTLVFLHGDGAGFGFSTCTPSTRGCRSSCSRCSWPLDGLPGVPDEPDRERFDQSGSTRDAVASGVASTARIITGAALIIVVVFAGFARGQLVMFQQMGFGVAVALLLDATVIRSVVLPSMLTLLGDRSWYLPRWLDWLPHVEVDAARRRSLPT
jgi:RND superfamily putative drug exporter